MSIARATNERTTDDLATWRRDGGVVLDRFFTTEEIAPVRADCDTLFLAKRTNGEIPPFPNLASATLTFGNLISLDGVHPAAAAHQLIANELIGVINAKYGTSLSRVP